MKNYKNDKFDDGTGEAINYHNPNWFHVLDYRCISLAIGSSGSEKESTLLNLRSNQPDIGKIYLTQKIHLKQNINCFHKRESVGLKHSNHPKAFVKYLNGMDKIHKTISEYNPNEKRKKLMRLGAKFSNQ